MSEQERQAQIRPATAGASDAAPAAAGPVQAADDLAIQASSARGPARFNSDATYRAIFEGNPGPMWVYDAETLAFLAVNDAATRLYGYSRDEFLGMTIVDIRPPEVLGRFWPSVSGNRPDRELSGPWTHQHRDGTRVEVEIASKAIEWEGRPARLVLVTDVTNRRQLEAQLRQSQRLEAVGRMAARVGHEFNNDLQMIVGYSGFLAAGLAPDDPRMADMVAIQTAAARATTLTRELLAFARDQESQPRPLDLSAVLRELEPMLRRLVPETLELRLHLADGLEPVKGDTQELGQVAVSLLLSACAQMRPGGVVSVETSSFVVDAGMLAPGQRRGRYVCLLVCDNSPALDREPARAGEPVFTETARLDAASPELASAVSIVREMGGYLRIQGVPGRGSSFSVLLPAARQASAPGPIEPVPPAQPGSEVILLVEDEDAIRSLARIMLSRRGYTVLPAPDGPSALDLVASHDGLIDLLMTDVVMPRMSGFHLADLLRQRMPALPVLFVSGYAPEQLARQDPGPPDAIFLEKPFTAETLAAAVRQAIEGPVRAPRPAPGVGTETHGRTGS